MTAIEACVRLMSRGKSVTIRWTPAHLGVEGNEMADLYAKGVAESRVYAVGGANLRGTSFAHTTRMTWQTSSAVPTGHTLFKRFRLSPNYSRLGYPVM